MSEVEVFAESFVGALLVGPGQATIAVHVRVKERRKFSSDRKLVIVEIVPLSHRQGNCIPYEAQSMA